MTSRRLLEAALVVAVAGFGAYVARRWLERRAALAAGVVPRPARQDAPSGASTRARRGVTAVPMIKLSAPPRPQRRPAVVPPAPRQP